MDDRLDIHLEVRTGHGEGELLLDVQAASCLGQKCRLRRRITLPVRLTAETDNSLVQL